jgi:hypothetical protein
VQEVLDGDEVAGTAESRMDEDVEVIIIFERGGRQIP